MRYFLVVLMFSSLKGFELIKTYWPKGDSVTQRFASVPTYEPVVPDYGGRYLFVLFNWDSRRPDIYYGGLDYFDNIPDGYILAREYSPECYGVGYINADSYADVVVSSFFSAHGESTLVKIFFGGEQMDSLPDMEFWIHIPTNNPGGVGIGSLCTTGDVNGDGYDDIILAGPMDSRAGFIVLLGGPLLDTQIDFRVDPPGGYGGSGIATGDINGDGLDDVIIGSYVSGTRVYFAPDFVNYVDISAAQIVYPTSASGDFNGDGYNDIILRDTNYNVYLHLGGDPPTGGVVWYDFPYEGMAIVPDLNGDGYDELVLGRYERAYIWFGRDSIMEPYAPADVIINHPPYEYEDWGELHDFGEEVLPGGDMNGDGINDLMVIAPTTWVDDWPWPNIVIPGRAYLYTGFVGVSEKGGKEKEGFIFRRFWWGVELKGRDIGLEVFDITGRRIFNESGNYIRWDFRDKPAGTYFLKIKTDGKVIKKIVKWR